MLAKLGTSACTAGVSGASPMRWHDVQSLRASTLPFSISGTFDSNLPGSSGACATGWDKLLAPQLDFRTRPCNLAELIPRLKE